MPKGYRLAAKIYINESLKEGEVQMPYTAGINYMPLIYLNPEDYKKVLEFIGREVSRNPERSEQYDRPAQTP